MSQSSEKIIVFTSFVLSVVSVFVVSGIILGVPYIGEEYLMSNYIQNWIPTIFVFAVCIFTIPAGQLSGKIGFKKSLVIGNVISLIGFVAVIFAFSAETFLLCRLIQGIGIAFSNVSEIAIIVLAIPESRRGRALGITATGVYLGTSAAPVIGGFLVANLGWRAIFYVSIPLLVICILLMIFKIDGEWHTDKNIKIDKIGSVFYMLGIFLFVLGFTDIITLTGQISVAVGAVLLIFFAWYESKREYPVFDVNLFKKRTFASYNFAGFCGYFAAMIVTTVLNYHFQYVLGWDPGTTGLMMLINPVIMSVVAVNAGRLSDKYHPQKIAAVGMFISIFAFIFMSTLNPASSLYIVVLAMILQAVGMGLFSSPNMNAVMGSVSPDKVSHASGAVITVRSIAQTMSMAFLTLVFSWIMGNLMMSTEYASLIVQSSGIVCLISAFVCAAAVLVSVIGIRAEKSSS